MYQFAPCVSAVAAKGCVCALACWKQEEDGHAEQSQLQDAESSRSNGGSVSKPG